MHAKLNHYKQGNLLHYFAGEKMIILIYKQRHNINLIYTILLEGKLLY